jgi:transposase
VGEQDARECGHEVLVASPRKVRLIYSNKRKTDEIDCLKNLARLARLDPKLLYPLKKHRGEDSQAHLVIIRSREVLVSCRTQLVNHIRGAVKSFGRLSKCPAVSFHKEAAEHIPEALWSALERLLETIGSLTERIQDYERHLETICQEHYPETDLLRQVGKRILSSWPPRRASGSAVPRCKSQTTKQAEIRFHASLGDGGREVRFEWGIG